VEKVFLYHQKLIESYEVGNKENVKRKIKTIFTFPYWLKYFFYEKGFGLFIDFFLSKRCADRQLQHLKYIKKILEKVQ
jgi:hypothetical protein